MCVKKYFLHAECSLKIFITCRMCTKHYTVLSHIQHEPKISTAACATYGCVCSTADCATPGHDYYAAICVLLLDLSFLQILSWPVDVSFLQQSVLPLHCIENSKQMFPEMKLRGLIPKFYIRVSASDF
jgi:hypothetical protein